MWKMNSNHDMIKSHLSKKMKVILCIFKLISGLFFNQNHLFMNKLVLGGLTFFHQIQIQLEEQNLFDNKIQNIKMGCENSNMVEVIPVEAQQIHDNPQEKPKTQDCNFDKNKPTPPAVAATANGKVTPEPDKENKVPEKLSIKLTKRPVEPSKENDQELTKRKSISEYRINEDAMNDTVNVQKPPTEEKKKSLIISEKTKMLSAKQIKEKIAQQMVVGPSTHSIPEEKPVKTGTETKIMIFVERPTQDLTTPIVVQKEASEEVKNLEEDPQIECLSEEIHSQRSGKTTKSFKFEVYVESKADILSKTEKLDHKIEIFIEKEEVAKYLQMLQFGEKEEILSKLYQELEKKEGWNELQLASSRSCEPMVVVVAENGVKVNKE